MHRIKKKVIERKYKAVYCKVLKNKEFRVKFKAVANDKVKWLNVLLAKYSILK